MESELVLLVGVLVLVAAGLYFGFQRRSLASDRGQTPSHYAIDDAPAWSVLHISPPAGAKWEPERAQRLVTSLFGLNTPFHLVLCAAAYDIGWRVEIGTGYQEVVAKSIYTLYPQAQIKTEPKTSVDLGYQLYQFEGATPFIGPLLYATDFRQPLSPVASVVGAMSDLADGEALVYEVALRPAQQDIVQIGEEMLTQSVVKWWDYLTIAGTISATAIQVAGADKTDKYLPEIRRMARAKLGAPLLEARLAVKVRAHSRQRMLQLITAFKPALATFGRAGFSFLLPASEQTFPLFLSAQEVAALWHLPADDCRTPGIEWAETASSPLPTPLLRAATVDARTGIVLGANTYHGRLRPVELADDDRVTHVNIIGRTRVGKSTLMHHMVHQDIRAGKALAVIDPHGDLVKEILACSIPQQRENDVVLFDVTDYEFPVGLNLLAVPPGLPAEVGAGYALAVIRKMFADNWHSGRMENVLYACLASLVTYEGATLMDVPRLLVDGVFRDQVLAQVEDLSALEYWYDVHELLRPAAQLEIAQPIISRIQRFYRDPGMRRIICQRHSLDVSRIVNNGQILLVNLGGLADVEGETLGALLISKIQMAAMSRATLVPEARRRFYCYIDEVQNFTTTSLSKMFSEAGKYGLSLIVANQYLRQLQGDTLEAIIGNVGTSVLFRCGPEDARLLAGFVKPQFGGDDLLNLDRFTTIVKMQHRGQTLPAFSMRTLPPPPVREQASMARARIRERSRLHHARHRDEVDAELAARYRGRAVTPVATGDDDPQDQGSGDDFLG